MEQEVDDAAPQPNDAAPCGSTSTNPTALTSSTPIEHDPALRSLTATALHALRYYSHAESKSADQDGHPCTRGTQGLLHKRHVTAGDIEHIGKEANHLDRRSRGEVDADEAADLLLSYEDPFNDTWIREDRPRPRLIPLAHAAAVTGLSPHQLRAIYAGRAPPRHSSKERLRKMIAELPLGP